MSSIGTQIKNLRKQRGMTQEELADKLHTTKQTVYKYETGIITNIPSDKIEIMAQLFNVSPAYIMGWEKPAEHTDFKDNLRSLREKRGMSQAQLAKELHLSRNAISMYECGERKPDFEMLKTIADFFNVDMDYLLRGGNASPYYLSPEAAEMAQEIYDRPELKVLFDASRKVSAEDIRLVTEMLDRMKKDGE